MKLLAFILTLVIFSQSLMIHVSDILAMEELVEHYQFHQEEYGDDFFNFLSKHYGNDKKSHSDSHQDEKKEHENLPFQHANHQVVNTVFFHEVMTMSITPIIIPESDKKVVKNESLKNKLLISGVFQPPKHA